MIKNINVLGLFGGASLNSVEIALVCTDGVDIQAVKKSAVVPYPEPLLMTIRDLTARRFPDLSALESSETIQKLQNAMTDFYADAINDFCPTNEVDEIGVDGLTVCHNPESKCSYQLEQGHELQKRLNRRVITHFHKADLLSGGQASPLTPAFFNAVAQHLAKPALFIDLQTVSSLIFLGESGEMFAFDCAPGIAAIENWTFRHANMLTDYNGRLAITGTIHTQIVDSLLNIRILKKTPPKSLDIFCFSDKREHLEGLSLEDGAATLTAFIARAINNAANLLPFIPSEIYLSGEGLKNPTLLRFLRQNFTKKTLKPVTEINSDYICSGAIATAFNAARRLYSLPLTFPATTGTFEPLTGGEIYD